MPRVSIGAARTFLGVGAVDAAARVSDLTSDSISHPVKSKIMESPDGSGYSMGQQYQTVLHHGTDLANAIAQAAPQAGRDALIAAATYVGYRGLKHLLGRGFDKFK